MRRIGVLMPFAADGLEIHQPASQPSWNAMQQLGWDDGRNCGSIIVGARATSNSRANTPLN